MDNTAARLDKALRAAGVAIDSVSIGRDDDRATWRVLPATLQAAAQPIIDAFVLPTPAQVLDEDAIRDVDMKALKAVVIEIYPYLGAGKPTLAQLRANIIARYKTL